MPRSVCRRLVLLGVAVCAVLGGPVAVAQASDTTIINTLIAYGPKIKHDEHAIKVGLQEYPKGKVRPLVRALTHEVGDLHVLANQLAHERPSSAKGRKAKKDLVNGYRLVATAYTELRNAVRAAHGGAVSPSAVNAAIATRNKGHAKVLAGFKLLGG